MKNFKPDVIKFKKPESEWTEEEHTEYTKWSLKLSMAHRHIDSSNKYRRINP